MRKTLFVPMIALCLSNAFCAEKPKGRFLGGATIQILPPRSELAEWQDMISDAIEDLSGSLRHKRISPTTWVYEVVWESPVLAAFSSSCGFTSAELRLFGNLLRLEGERQQRGKDLWYVEDRPDRYGVPGPDGQYPESVLERMRKDNERIRSEFKKINEEYALSIIELKRLRGKRTGFMLDQLKNLPTVKKRRAWKEKLKRK